MMRRRVWELLALVVLLVCVGVWWVYEHAGVKQYIERMREIHNLSVGVREKAEAEFFGQDENGRYAGVVMRVNVDKDGSVWVWGSRGPKYYKANKDSVFSYYSICQAEHLTDLIEGGQSVEIDREVYTDIDLWNEKVETGDYVVVKRAIRRYGSNSEELREVWAYDWWPMMPTEIREQCVK